MSCKHPTVNVKEVTGPAFVAVCDDCGATSGPASSVDAATVGFFIGHPDLPDFWEPLRASGPRKGEDR